MPRRAGLARLALNRYFPPMTKLEKIEREIESLPPQEMRALAKWFSDLRERLWERDVEAGIPEIDALAEQAIKEHRAGKTTPLVRR
jgi:hypothetical protein